MPPKKAAGPAEALGDAPTRSRAGVGWLEALASLRLTVTLFALTIVLVFVGTLAQVDHDIWYVVNGDGWNGGYFRVWFAKFEYQAFNRLLLMFTKGVERPISGGFWFPGGLLLGSLMFANLLAAHAIRFKVAARGSRLTLGLGVLAAGVAATVGVIAAGMDQSLKGQLSSEFCDVLWQALRALLAGGALGGVWWSMHKFGKLRPAEWWLATAFNATLLGVAVYLYANPSVGPDEAGMRIVWELTKSGGAAVLTLLGCWLVFKQRAGIVLLHAGIGMLMIGELVTHLSAVEGQMRIREGETVNYVDDIRSFELAISTDDGDATRVTAVPASLLAAAVGSGEPIRHEDLPFDLRVLRYEGNSRLVSARGDNPSTAGAGLQTVAEPARSVSGVSMESGVNLPSAYIEPLDKDTGESLGVWLVSASFQMTPSGGFTGLRPQPIVAAEETHRIELRFERTYKPYSVTLNDFRFDKYVGTEKAKNFSSDVVLTDPSRGVERPVRIWMNNPLRYAGDTLYQSSFDNRGPVEATVLQVVTNGGWMIPYVSCVFVGLGMLSHFLITLSRFARRRVEEANRAATKTDEPENEGPGWLSPELWKRPTVWGPALAALITAGYLAGKARPVADEPGRMPIARFGALPVAEGGRIKPIDTLARHTLQHFSARQEVLPADEGKPRVSASEWLLDTISGRDGWRDHRAFRIENLELLDALNLEPRKGSFRYSYSEVMADGAKTEGLFQQAFEQYLRVKEVEEQGGPPVEPLTIVQDKTLELRQKIMSLRQLVTAFGTPNITVDGGDLRQQLMRAQPTGEVLRRSGAVRAVPPSDAEGEWSTLFESELLDIMRRLTGAPLDPAGQAWSRALMAYAAEDVDAFTDRLTDLEGAIEKYQRDLEGSPAALASLAPAERLSASKVRFEHFFSAFSPFYYCAVMYLTAFLLACCGWLGKGDATLPRSLSRAATAIIVVTLLVHTFALVSRMYISGRPPVTNLYTTAIFIGWAAVLFCLAYEAIYRLGIGSAVASVIGFATLVVAHYLSLDGDTFTVLQAVLDTQFWLATHVVCITLGYATVYGAGAFGIVYLLALLLSRFEDKPFESTPSARQMTGTIYGMLCFATLFSFVGTVLGGLWADDSWGRFWGWDPKENGALIIVLWTALVVHARWGKLVGPPGLAMLAVVGNIVTTWSWFGVNELGVGLHAYGANDSPTALYMLGFILSQLLVCLFGLAAMAIPKKTPA